MTSSQKNDPVYLGWVEHHAGYEYTKSELIIRQTLTWLLEKRVFVTIFHKGYQSGGTVVIELSDESLVIDKPRDWPETHATFRVIFRNAAKLWSHFRGELLSASSSSLYVKFPEELFLLQRRQHYRLNLPEGSGVTFLYNQKKCKLNMRDLSTGGMLLSSRDPQELPQERQTIHNISIAIPSEDTMAGAENGILRFKIKEGEVVRAFANAKLRLFFAGVRFYPSRQEEDRIMKYIRQRELTLLRKGIHD
ncbi:MAG: hypothetical protein HY885_11500 [Deltaproteobacteria bacterium]|nr:hypothetical protein [Deltaproteobacteria bacterium]